VAGFQPTTPDGFNWGAGDMLAHGALALYPVFVDDTSTAHVHSKILPTITALVLSAYVVFGFPGGNPWANRPPCINAQKWSNLFSHQVTFPTR